MERLTKRTICGTANLAYPESCYFKSGAKDQIAVSAYRQQAIERLAEYEDTGLEPEKIVFLKNVVDDAFSDKPEFTEHIRELLRAEQDGRLVVLPCKVGDTLWVTGRDNVPREMELEAPDIRTVCTDEDNLCMSTCNRKPDGFCAYRLRNDGADIGKTVFLTREEAEKALEARENG